MDDTPESWRKLVLGKQAPYSAWLGVENEWADAGWDGRNRLAMRDQILRRKRGQQGENGFPVQLTTSRIDWQTYPVGPYSAESVGRTYHTMLHIKTEAKSHHGEPIRYNSVILLGCAAWDRIQISLVNRSRLRNILVYVV